MISDIQCSAVVQSIAGFPYHCGRSVMIRRNGKWWCSLHDPERKRPPKRPVIRRKKPKYRKTLGQIAYESTNEGGMGNFGPWKTAPGIVRRIHDCMAQAVKWEVNRRIRNER